MRDAPDRIAYTSHRFLVDEYFCIAKLGVLKEGDRVEVIGGQVLVLEPPGPEHASHSD